MFQKQNTHKNSFPCEPCEGTCEPFSQIITTLKAFSTNAFIHRVNHVNDFLARAREGKKHIPYKINQFKPKFDHILTTSENTSRASNHVKSFTSFTRFITLCFYLSFHGNDCSKSFTRSFTSFTWI